jgi:hypothetical protein
VADSVGALCKGHPLTGAGVPRLQRERLHPGKGAGIGELVEVDLIELGLCTQIDVERDRIRCIVCRRPACGGVAVRQETCVQGAILVWVGGARRDRLAESEVRAVVAHLVLDRVGVHRVSHLRAERGLRDADVDGVAVVQVGAEEVLLPDAWVVATGIDEWGGVLQRELRGQAHNVLHTGVLARCGGVGDKQRVRLDRRVVRGLILGVLTTGLEVGVVGEHCLAQRVCSPRPRCGGRFRGVVEDVVEEKHGAEERLVVEGVEVGAVVDEGVVEEVARCVVRGQHVLHQHPVVVHAEVVPRDRVRAVAHVCHPSGVVVRVVVLVGHIEVGELEVPRGAVVLVVGPP